MISPSLIQKFASPENREFAEQAMALTSNHIKLAEFVRTRFGHEEAAQFISMLMARNKAKVKFTKWDSMFFTEELLEQSTSETVSLFKGEHYFTGIDCADLCCGAGGSLIGMARHGSSVTGCDIEPAHIALAQLNMEIYGLQKKCTFTQGDITRDIPPASAYHFDPSRRTLAGREYLPDNYLPPLSTSEYIREISPDLIVKVSPLHSVDCGDDFSTDIISCNGEVKEILLCYGRYNSGQTRAIILPETTVLTYNLETEPEIAEEIGSFVFEPDPAIVKAGITASVAASFGLKQTASGVRYLTGSAVPETTVLKAFEVLEVIPFNFKKLNRYLKGTDITTVDVKCKDSTIKPVSITKKLKTKGKGSDRISLFYIEQDDGERIFILARRMGI